MMQVLILALGLATAVRIAVAMSNVPDTTLTTNAEAESGLIAIAAGLAMGLSAIGAALGLGTAASSAAAAITERPESFGKLLVLLALIEAIAIYGFVIAFVLAGNIS